jgi:hypothetical protein
MVLDLIVDINIIHHKKNSPKNFTYDLRFEEYMQFSTSMTSINFSKTSSIHSRFLIFLELKFS